MKINKKKLISFVVPIFNEEKNIPVFNREINKFINNSLKNYNTEIIYNDNCSTDSSFDLLKKIKTQNKNPNLKIKINRFSKNVGYQNSIFYGYRNSNGDAVVQLDCDLQDPLIVVNEFIKFWEDGYKIVYGIRKNTGDKIFLKLLRKLFYRILNLLSNENIPIDAGDFRLVDKAIIKHLNSVDDKNLYLRGLLASFGFKQKGIPYDRNIRKFGISKFSIYDLFKLAFDGVLNHSIAPLRLASLCGLIISIVMIIGILIYSILRISTGIDWPTGFTTLTVLILFSIALNAIFLGIIGE